MPKAKKTRVSAKKNGTTKKTAKTASQKKVRGVGPLAGELPYPMKVRGNLQLHLRAVAAEVGQLEAQVETATSKLDIMRRDPTLVKVFIAQQERRNLHEELKVKRQEYAAVQLEVGEKLKIPPEELNQYTFDPDNGVVTYNGPAPPK